MANNDEKVCPCGIYLLPRETFYDHRLQWPRAAERQSSRQKHRYSAAAISMTKIDNLAAEAAASNITMLAR